MDVQLQLNCGTGSGGFHPGNNCAGGGSPLDHGELSIPNRTKNIDRDIDKYKAEQAAAKRAANKAGAAEFKADKAAAKELFAAHGEAMVEKYGEKFGVAKLRATLEQMVKWEPKKFRALVEKFLKEGAAEPGITASRDTTMHTGLSLSSGEAGHWVTIDDHPVFIGDDIGEGAKGKGGEFTRHALEKKLVEHHEATGGADAARADETAMQAHYKRFTFHGELPAEVKQHIENNPAARRLFKVTQDPTAAGGADALSEMGDDRYFAAADRYANGNLREAVNSANKHGDPEIKFVAALHEDMGAGVSKVKQGILPAEHLRAGQAFTINGRDFTVEQTPDGLVLNGGRDFPKTPVAALTKVPIDKGSLKAPKRSDPLRAKADAVAPFSADSYVLHLDDTKVGPPLPLGLEGLPTANSEGEKIHYRRLKIAEVGDWTHRGTGEPFAITAKRADEWIANTTALAASGHKPFIAPLHPFDATGAAFVEPDARDTLGYVERVERSGNDVYAVVGLHGDESLKVAARNSRSVGVAKRDARDAKGNVFAGEFLHHLALCPNSALPNLGGTARLAASADRPAGVPVYTLAAATPLQEFTMTKETAQRFREAMKVAANVPDDKLADLAADKAIALSADVTKLTTERDTLTRERDAKAQEVLSLSASDKEPDAHTMVHVSRAMQSARAELVKSGVVSEGGAKEIDSIFLANGKPNKLALSLSANPQNGQQDWLYTRLLDVIARNPGVKTGNEIPRDVAARADAEDAVRLSLSGDPASADAKKRDRQAELLAEQLGTKK